MLLLLGYLGGLAIAFAGAVLVLLSVQGFIPEKVSRHPRLATAIESAAVDPGAGHQSRYEWGPRVAPGIPPGEKPPILSEAARLKEMAKGSDEGSREARREYKKRHVRRQRDDASGRVPQPNSDSAVALGYAGETAERTRIW